MATQTDVQQMIQSLVPSGVNNGNPGTVYNTPVPTVDAYGRWTSPKVNPAATLPALSLPALGGSSLGGWLPPGSGASPGGQGPILPQMPPLGPPTGGGGVTSGPVAPPTVAPPGTPVPPSRGGGGGSPVLPPNVIYPEYPLTMAPPPATVDSGPFGWGRPVYGPGPISGGGGGSSGGGGSGLGNLLTWLTGGAYQGNTGEFDISNTLQALAGQLVPGGSWLFNKGMKYLTPGLYDNHIRDNMRNKMEGNYKDVQNDTNKRVSADTQRILDEMFPQSKSGGSTDRGGRQSAGATTIAEGKDAQDMVADMQLQYFLNKTKQQARDAMNPRYQYER